MCSFCSYDSWDGPYLSRLGCGFFFRTDAGPPAGGISNPHPHPQYAGAGVGPPTGEISDPHPHPSGLKSADTRIRGWNCHPYMGIYLQ